MDGKLIFEDPLGPDVVQRSIGAGMSRNGPAPANGLSFWVFDSFANPRAPFFERYAEAEAAVVACGLKHVLMTPQFTLVNAADLADVEREINVMSFEGVMLRDPAAAYVFGRLDAKTQWLMKLKRRAERWGRSSASCAVQAVWLY